MHGAADDRRAEALADGSRLAARLFDALAGGTADPPGVTRAAYGAGECAAFALMAEAAGDLGGDPVFDPAGNQFLTFRGADRGRTVYVGSHLDSVPHGGNFDGAAGVILGLAAAAALTRLGTVPAFDLCVLCLRAEESCWFPHSYIGSKTALGCLPPDVLDAVVRSDTGRSLAGHMRDLGFDPEAVRRGASRIDRARTVAYLEPHIEQGPVLVAEGRPLGLVTGIRGSFRFREAAFHGAYAHSGATPRTLRRDAVVAASEFVMAMQALWERMERDGHDLAVTFGMIGTDPAQHSFSKVAGEARLCIDVRSQSEATLEEVRRRLVETGLDVAARRDVRLELGPLGGSTPAVMAPRLLAQMRAAAATAGIAPIEMASGAGHDAATFANAGVPTGMLFIRNRNGSHNPDEAMDMGDFDAALALVVALLEQPAEHWG
ncbi:hydantoinase/carbamoylase family amidase [Rhodoplanes sp. TEM]|uniref:Hydantoinase/carbamoylase family amidase n=1 Tax=Rhodoplanes tepidamans TaxID=200616 RepID=A0ABT5JFR3_RHOTP|nr:MULTISPECIES: hydantoinase/carbamoylase family amidase [Rhodoplanes]MDC7788521.1 hydantoinase/carbamoylase family amidase [Rhodoplanes tepidamans]MDC7985120.1 hydantoinase/carbamoylase family amidase [Rhodoplanes sp. TEM]MDQ0353420.1 N-carbamoyl-L-amino-acid hydrolase [Rhodoplanes tepidamans]